MYVLGLLGEPQPIRATDHDIASQWRSGWYHDSAAVLLKDGEVVAAIEEERLSRNKHTGKFPRRAIQFCLSHAGIELEDVDLIAYGEQGGHGPCRDPEISEARIAQLLQREVGAREDLRSRIRLVEHHIGHAMSAFGCSGLDRSLILTADGFGDGVAGLIAEGGPDGLSVLSSIPLGQSLGAFYLSVVEYLGFGVNDEYKVMGLAPYGNASAYAGLFRDHVVLKEAGQFEIRPALLEGLLTLGPRRERHERLGAVHRDVAAALQGSLEETVFHVLRYFQGETGHRDLCLAGGVAQNCSLNGKILASGLFERVFVQPASYDAGVALGAALHVWEREGTPNATRTSLTHVFLGPSIGEDEEIRRLLERWESWISVESCAEPAVRAADLLVGGSVLGWVQGRSEFGPRALGNRSILADPRPASNRERVNEIVKKREGFRPFAPAVTEEAAHEYFDLSEALRSPFMTFAVPVRKAWRKTLGAVTHADFSARVQTVSKATNERFWRLLGEFGERTGVPVLLNTSFNNDREPIVDSVDDAVACFLTTGLDHLIVGNFLVEKKRSAQGRCLGLRAEIPSDQWLVRGKEELAGAGQSWVYGLIGARQVVTPLSEGAFQLLTAHDEREPLSRTVGRLEKTVPYVHSELEREIYALWSERKIRLLPPSC